MPITKKLKLSLLTIITIFWVLFFILISLKYSTKNNQIKPAANINQLSGFLTYQSPKYGYQFKYPAYGIMAPDMNLKKQLLEYLNIWSEVGGPWIISVRVSQSNFFSLDSWFNAEAIKVNKLYGSDYNLKIDKQIIVSGVSGLVTFINGVETDKNQKSLVLIKDRLLYEFNYRLINEMEFLSSVEFQGRLPK